MFDNIALGIIMLCHFLVVCFVVGVPFFGNNYLLLMHSICVPFMMVHWLLNDNTCALSMMEVEIRKRLGHDISKKDCFTCQLINPIYDFKATYEDWTMTIYSVTTFLWFVSLYRLYCAYESGELRDINDLVLGRNNISVF